MNNTLKIATGAVVGAGVGWFIGAVIAEYINLIEEEKHFHYQDGEMPLEETEENQRPIEMSKHKQPKRVVTVDYTRAFTVEDKADLQALAAKYNQGIIPPDPDLDVAGENTWVDEDDNTIDSGPIRIISAAEYAVSDNGYQHITLLYFDDDVVTDENRKIFNDPEKLIGEEALVSFGVLSEKEDTVYIRNDEREKEFEIIRMDEPFINDQKARNAKADRFDHVKEDEGEGEDS
jgi:hypothetical protein